MIFAGFLLLAIGVADIVRGFVPRAWIGYLVAFVVLGALGVSCGGALAFGIAVIAAALWLWSVPVDRPRRGSFWPAVIVAAAAVLTVVVLGDRNDAGYLGNLWEVPSPFGEISIDAAILALGAVAFLLESGNVVVRAVLNDGHAWRPDAAARSTGAAEEFQTPPVGGFRGGRLIGPLERLIVFLLTLAGAYPVLAAILAAKGIVRFPEISKDGETGARAEYFLVGSLVSWVIALGAAFLLWWAIHT